LTNNTTKNNKRLNIDIDNIDDKKIEVILVRATDKIFSVAVIFH